MRIVDLDKAYIEFYLDWVSGALLSGHVPTNYYNHKWDLWNNAKFASVDFVMKGECGVASRMIIVDKGVKVRGNRGHNELFFMEDYSYSGYSFPMYNDPCFLEFPVLDKLIKKNMKRK